jgi:hypothetical protein
MIKSVWLTSEPKIGVLSEPIFSTLLNFWRGVLRGHPHTLRFPTTARAPRARFGPSPERAIPHFARARNNERVDLTADLAVKNLLDNIMIYSSGRFTGANASLAHQVQQALLAACVQVTS